MSLSAAPVKVGYTISGYGKSTDERTGAVQAWVRATGVGTVHKPDFPGSLESATLEREEEVHEGDKWTVTRYYASTPSSVAAKTEYQLDVSLSNESIETHPKFKTVIATESNGAQFDATTGEFQGFFKYPKDGLTVSNEEWIGVRDYLAPGVIWRETSYGGDYSGVLSGIGKIDTPPGPCPSAPSGMNWLYVGGSASRQGGLMVRRREWRLSGPRGWNSTIYST